MQHYTSFRVGDVLKFKEQYYLLLEFEKPVKEGMWDQFTALLLNTGAINSWMFREQIFIKVA